MLTFDHVSFQYDTNATSVIQDLSFHIAPGEFVSMIGPSGCGKSTIFRLINQLLPLEVGAILVDGETLSKEKHLCGYMPQHDLLFPWRTVADNVRLPLEIRGGYSKAEMNQRVESALATVGLKGWGAKMPSALSGGMRQRAAFARTILTGRPLLLLDEPFSALDYLTRLHMREWLLAQWKKENKTILFITHDVEEAVFLSTRILIAEETPICKLTSREVPLDYPRTREDMAKPEIVALKESLIAMLGGKTYEI